MAKKKVRAKEGNTNLLGEVVSTKQELITKLSESYNAGLVGMWFHSINLKGKIEWQGLIMAQLQEGYYLIRTFDWIIGLNYTDRIIHIRRMARWEFYSNNEEMKECWEYHIPDWRKK